MIRLFLGMGCVANTPQPEMRERRFSIKIMWEFGNLKMWKSGFRLPNFHISRFPHPEGGNLRGRGLRLRRREIPHSHTCRDCRRGAVDAARGVGAGRYVERQRRAG